MTTPAIEQKLMRAMMHFRRLSWYPQTIAGLKPSEIRVLICVKRRTAAESSELKVSEISKMLQVTSPTVTQLLKSLEAHDLIERHIDTFDRRAVGVRLTEKGERVAQEAHEAFTSSIKGLIEYLGEEQSDQLAELLTRVSYYFSESEREAD
ncbi:MarR family winged helix-turn-helix transcriptional regulator [Ktedonospora formicarum]|nr:MarR family winged helix-turn-helix transcriptional regulator [Ktedonospora formicarum]